MKSSLSYSKFENYGLNIVAAFDIDKDKIGKSKWQEILPMEELENTCKPLNIHIGIITVPVQCAQEVCDKLIECGILAIWDLRLFTF